HGYLLAHPSPPPMTVASAIPRRPSSTPSRPESTSLCTIAMNLSSLSQARGGSGSCLARSRPCTKFVSAIGTGSRRSRACSRKFVRGILTPIGIGAALTSASSASISSRAGSDAATDVDADAVLFPLTASAGLPDTAAVFAIDPAAAGADTTIDSGAFPPLPSAPTVQVTVPALFTQPALADPNTTPAGNLSV